MRLEFESIPAFGFAPAAELHARVFADYFVRFAFSEASLRAMAHTDSIRFEDSRVVHLDGEPAGVAFIAQRGRTSRLAGMGLLPSARGRGVGEALMHHLLEVSETRGDDRMLLEVIEQNPRAVRLYEKMGFSRLRRLVGFVHPATAPVGVEPSSTLREVSLPEVGDAIRRFSADPDWPWQISGETVAALNAPVRGYAGDGAWIAISDPTGLTITVRGLAGENPVAVTDLLRTVMALHPGRSWRAAALWPEIVAPWFSTAGWVPPELSQWQMVRRR